MVTVKLFVEGGGESKALIDRCRAGFRKFLERAGLGGFMPRIVACGSRNGAHRDFCTAVHNGEPCMLLVDSEDSVAPTDWNFPWRHLDARDRWRQPNGASDDDCHLMVQCMEAWFLADRGTLASFFGQEFNAGSLPGNRNVEMIPKDDVFSTLERATRQSRKGSYDKGRDSFDLLAIIDPASVCAASPWADRFVLAVRRRMMPS